MSMIITTSDFTKSALRLIEETNVEKWDWDYLHRNIKDTYLDGKDIYSFFPDLINKPEKRLLEFEINKVDYNFEIKGGELYTLIFVTVKNNGANTQIALALPIIITLQNKQLEADYWLQGYFKSGTVYSGSSVEVAFMFMTEQLDQVSVGDRIIFEVFDDIYVDDDDEPETYEIKSHTTFYDDSPDTYEAEVSDTSHRSCYVATLCYGKESREYLELTYFRDNYLLKHDLGRIIVRKYYKYGGILLAFLENSRIAKFASKIIIKLITIPISILNLYIKKNLL